MNSKINYDKNRSNPQYAISDQVLVRLHGPRSKLDPRYSLTPKIIIQKQHPIYWVRDQLNDLVYSCARKRYASNIIIVKQFCYLSISYRIT